MKNAATGRAKADLPLLYDELESKLRSLESLGKTQDKYGDFLTPLVESCLPEEVLVAWERSRNHQTESEGSRSLEQLMNFLRQEVKGEEMVLLARTGLTPYQNPRKRIIMQHRIKILPDGRYEVELPWKYDSLKLPSNKELVWKRHEGMIDLDVGNFFMDYQKVFQDWEKLNIIERVPDLELNKECHYLTHRPVIKLDSQTTKIRPVFDASASEKGNLL
ncbi:uncharacterized protein TNCV_3564591 [Trichonephila clavipes]|nr:uncharacterized protein TNCV_3564591 [Trichonephila clavipes]